MITPISFVLLGISHLIASHMIMKTPIPFSASKFAIDNSPLSETGSDYPCKLRYDPEGAMNEMPLGSTQKLSFTGHAVHGGGSCQVSIAYDSVPSANTTFKVIHSIMGGCPSRNSPDNSLGPDEYDFKIPENMPTGNAILAWTWFNKVGNREMYMDCAPIMLTGGSKKRDPEETKLLEARAVASYEALPNIMVANIHNGCATKESQDYKFENPGDSVEINVKNDLHPFLGCCGGQCYGGINFPVNPVNGQIPTSFTPDQNPNQGGTTPAPDRYDSPQAASPDAQTSGQEQGQTQPPSAEPASAQPAAAEPGAFFTTGAEPIRPSNDQITHVKPAPSDSPKSPFTGPETNSTASTDTETGAPCSPEGLWNCVGGHSYQQCASGAWSVVMPMAAGTQCQEGKSKTFNVHAISHRSLRHPRSHLRRHQLGLNYS